MLILSIIWEFLLEGHVHQFEQEPFGEKVEYVVTVFVFALLALIGPLLFALRAEKDRKKWNWIVKN